MNSLSIQRARRALCEDSYRAIEKMESCVAKMRETYPDSAKIAQELSKIEENIELLKIALVAFKSEGDTSSKDSIYDKMFSGILSTHIKAEFTLGFFHTERSDYADIFYFRPALRA